MNDRELLEMAAKAAGIKGKWYIFPGMEIRYGFEGAIYNEVRDEYWNPLTDDGDALRLAVKLQMDLYIFDSCVGAVTAEIPEIEEDAGDDIQAATRRAIVRVAAAIGEDMP